MDKEFWHRRWEKNEIGFHLTEAHHYLRKFFCALQMQRGTTVFVPLCGKSPDLIWLREQGLNVVGIELSRTAVEAFFNENALHGEWTVAEEGLSCHADGYQIFCRDVFKLTAADVAGVRAAYDRGSLVALPPAMRTRYARHLATLLPTGSRVLLIGYDYDQREAAGPPFSVPRQELEVLFRQSFQLELLAEEDVLWSHQGLAEKGVTQLREYAVLLLRH